jgi:RNA exonuclease 4
MCKPQNDIQIDTSAYIEVSKYDEEHSLTNKNDTVQYSKKLVKKPANNDHNNAQKKKKNDDHHTKKAKKIKKNALKEKNRRITQRKQLLAKMEAEQEISLKEQGKYLALDCEMVGVGEGGFKSALARVSIVDYNNAIVFDTYVKVSEPVTDYRTFVSGVRPEHIESDLAMEFKRCQEIVKKLLHGKILVGHALKNDMQVLDIEHPWYLCRDTAKYELFMKKDKKTDILRPRKLKDLAETKLNRIIQLPGQEHCPVEDAIAALDLYKKARIKWEKAMTYKVNKTNTISDVKCD